MSESVGCSFLRRFSRLSFTGDAWLPVAFYLFLFSARGATLDIWLRPDTRFTLLGIPENGLVLARWGQIKSHFTLEG